MASLPNLPIYIYIGNSFGINIDRGSSIDICG